MADDIARYLASRKAGPEVAKKTSSIIQRLKKNNDDDDKPALERCRVRDFMKRGRNRDNELER